MGKDALSAHPVQKYWKERKQKEKKRKAKSIHKQSKRPSIDSLEEEIASLVQKKNEGVLLNAERDRLRYLVQLHDNILEKQSKNFRNVDKLQSSQDPLDPEYGEDSRTETRKRLLGVQAFQRILEKSVSILCLF